MRFAIYPGLAVVVLLHGCTTVSPFAEAERGASYTLEEFGKAVIAEKVAFLKNELRNLQAPDPEDPNQVKLSPFPIREFPTLSEWATLKAKSKPGDRIWEFHHKLYMKVYDGPAEASKHGYALMREDRIVAFVYVDGVFSVDY